MTDFTKDKPTVAGAYWVRAPGLKRTSLVEVAPHPEHAPTLLVNLHDYTTTVPSILWYQVDDLSPGFEWCGPLLMDGQYRDLANARAATVARLKVENDALRGEPAVLPARLPMRSPQNRTLPKGYAEAWNACLSEIEKLGPLYVRSTSDLPKLSEADLASHWVPCSPAWLEACSAPCNCATAPRLLCGQGQPAQQQQGEPISPAFIMPSCENSYGFGYVDGTCIQSLRGYRDHLEEIVDSIPEGPLYIHPAPADTAEVERLRELSVTSILLDVVPGDGNGYELFANSVADVEHKLSSMGDRIELLDVARVKAEELQWAAERKLVEAHALLRMFAENSDDGDVVELARQYLSTSAEPGGPKAFRELRIVTDRLPDSEGCRFIEVEDADGKSVRAGKWRSRNDGTAELVILMGAHSVFGDYALTLVPFVRAMVEELNANSHKGNRPGWLRMDAKAALLELHYHVAKLHYAVAKNDEKSVAEFSADVANCCMMLSDVCGFLVTEADQ